MRPFSLIALWLAIFLSQTLAAKPLAPQDAPEPLKPWIGWALYDEEQRLCPFLYSHFEERRCAWPSRLELNLEERYGSFTAFWQVDAESWVDLPGDTALWPQQVELDGKPALVSSRADGPALWLTPGKHRLSGRFAWKRLPESLAIPRDSGLISLMVKGKPVKPVFNEQQQLWIQGEQWPQREDVANGLTLRVFRKITDAAALRVTTRLDLEVAGVQREVLLSGSLLPDSIPLQLNSPLPARLETDGRLRVLVRPGHWQIELIGRHSGEILALSLPSNPVEDWPDEEIWSFEANREIRVVEIGGAPAVVPRETEMPQEWKNLPAYRLQAGGKLDFKPLRRGDPDAAPDRLTLRRQFWLDFDGGGYTVRDEIDGSLSRDWRLEALAGGKLGRVDIDGAPQLITFRDASGPSGVEIRRGQVRLGADSRVENGLSRLSATGWARDFQSVSAELNLPPGWRLLAATGVDNAPGTWVGAWTLLDLFLALIATLVVVRLRGGLPGILAAAALALLWHEPNAPRYVWLNLLVAIALLQELPTGRIAQALRFYRNLTALVLAFIALPFMVEQVRLGIYPQLESPRAQAGASPRQDKAPAAPQAMAPPVYESKAMSSDQIEEPATAPPPALESVPRPAPSRGELRQRQAPEKHALLKKHRPEVEGGAEQLSETDPDAITQTGPGLPQWHWNTVVLSWNGPVLGSQEFRLFLLSPSINLLLNLLRVILLIALAWVLLMGGRTISQWPWPGIKSLSLLVLAALCVPQAKADMPAKELLEELKTRLLAPPECLPECAQISLMRLRFGADELSQVLEIHAQAATAVPLPAQEGQWLPSQSSVDGAAAERLFRSADGGLWLGLPAGRHEVVLAGPLPARGQVQLALPLRPHRVELEGGGWRVEGIKENGEPEPQLQLTRTLGAEQAAPELEARPLPPFLEVQRTLHLGLNWRVVTRVVRISPTDSPVVVEIPLLEGESVTSSGLQVKNGLVAVSLASGQEEMDWESTLEKRPAITLKAPDTTVWTEIWRADVSPVWHLESSGIAVVRQQDGNGNRMPEWRPWPGETATLQSTRPQGAPGASLTIDSSRLRLSPGLRATDASLNLIIRSSQGGQHSIKLPEGAVLQSVIVDGVIQPIRQQGRTVTLPVHPGSQNLDLSWREDRGISPRFVSPELDLGIPSVNSLITIVLGRDRWVLLTVGPRLGPAVLFWGGFVVLGWLAFGLGRLQWTPLAARQWFLLLIGLSQVELFAAACVVAWLFALGWRGRRGSELSDIRFNSLQLGLVLLSLLALLSLFFAVHQGLLGMPDMQVAGNHSSPWNLNWYQDRNGQFPPRPWVLSASLWTYRILMLAWALWLALALLNWLRWGFGCFAGGGLWRPRKPKIAASGEKGGKSA
ncbi:MAG: hypothetical protein PHE55_00795 [Methylococcaceae bacterium]|nr:hypothetical protein [Methylococcaceae bacterium]